ncbi:reverse transcriptase domain-containing protein [Tanacetum coccineum]
MGRSKQLASTTLGKVLTFVYDQIITRFGMPHTIVTDNSTKFIEETFKSWYETYGIDRATISSYHSQANVQAEVANKEIVKDDENQDSLRLDLALAEQKCNPVTIRLEHSKDKMTRHYNKRVRPVSFKLSDHVMRKNKASKVTGQRKLAPNCEGLNIVRHANDNGSYLLTTSDGDGIPLA